MGVSSFNYSANKKMVVPNLSLVRLKRAAMISAQQAHSKGFITPFYGFNLLFDMVKKSH